MALSLVTVSDVENVKTHSSPLQRMGSALHTYTYRCHGVPGISEGRVGGHGCQEEVRTRVKKGPTSQVPASRQEAFGRAPAKALKGKPVRAEASKLREVNKREGAKVPSLFSRALGNDSAPPCHKE